MRSGQVTPIPPGGNVSRSTMSSSLPALPTVPSDPFYDTMEIADPTSSLESASTVNAMRTLFGPGGCENITLRMKPQALSEHQQHNFRRIGTKRT